MHIMKHCIHRPLSTNPTISNAILCSAKSLMKIHVSAHSLTTSAASATIADSDEAEEQEEEERGFSFSNGVIEYKDLLRKTQNGGLFVLDLIDRGMLEPDGTLYNQLINRCTQFGKLKEGRIIHRHFLNSNFSHYQVVQNTILNMYAKLGSLEEARKVFDEMPTRDMVTWTALITGYSQNDLPENAISLFPPMLRLGLKPNHFTFSSLLKAAGARPSDREGTQIHGYSMKVGYDSNVYVGSALVDMYARCMKMEEAQFVFDRLLSKNEVSWNALIAGHARKGEGENALRLFAEMRRANFTPTHFTFSSIFAASASIGALEQGKWVHAHMIKSGLKLIAFVGNTLLDMYAKSGSIDDSRKVFDRLVTRDVVSWNSMLTALAQHGFGKETVESFEKMLRIGIEPNAITFLSVLNACSHGGILDKGQFYFDLMKKFNIEPELSHYVTMVDLMGRAGLLNRAMEFINEMPIQPSAAVWKALLGACRMHKNTELGAFAAERVFELDPIDSGPHIILSNIYASAGMRKEAASVRKTMKLSGVKKEPACSWVEIENSVHMFVANDDSHPQREEIRKKWEEISEKIRRIGYVPDKSHVLLFEDEEEREVKLQYHSEKLALGFALLNTVPGSTVRIKKNIRVCGDCHSAFKFVSKLVGREIVLRDTNRFHHFRDGSCSCEDYW